MLDSTPLAALAGLARGAEEALTTVPLYALAVIQGLTEFLPVSSSGHLVLGSELLGVEAGEGLLQAVALHFGTLLAVLLVYFPELRKLLDDARERRFRMVGMIALASVPAVVAGLYVKRHFESVFEDPTVAACGLLVTAAVLLWGEGGRRKAGRSVPPGVVPEDRPFGPLQALLIGCSQAVAILPGISRSGSTIATGMRLGLSPSQAARFSFLLSIPVIGGASLLTGLEAWQEGVETVSPAELAIGVLVSAVVGWIALRLLLVLLGRGVFPVFAAYCALLGSGWLLFG